MTTTKKGQSQGNKSVATNQESSLPNVHVRRLTVSYMHHVRDRFNFDSWENRDKIPYLKLCGIWLEDAGFTVSSKVNVIVKNNLLIIEPVKE